MRPAVSPSALVASRWSGWQRAARRPDGGRAVAIAGAPPLRTAPRSRVHSREIRQGGVPEGMCRFRASFGDVGEAPRSVLAFCTELG